MMPPGFRHKERRKMKHRVLLFLIVVVCVGQVCHAQTVVSRKRLGNNSEDITAIHSGQLAKNIAIIDGTDVLALTEEDDDNTPHARKLFSVLGLGVLGGPRGIAYNETQQRFIFNDPVQTLNTLVLSDNLGNPQGTIAVSYPAGFTPDWIEGLAWLPPSAAHFPNDILEVAITFGAASYTSRLEVIDPSGQVVAEIFPKIPDPDPFDNITGLAFQFPDRLLVGTGDGVLWQIDFSGNVLAGPVTFPGVADLEGIAQIDDDHIAVASYDAGKVMFVDEHLDYLSGQDRNYRLGFGLSLPRGVAWDSDTGQHLVSFPGIATAPSNAAQVVSLTNSLGSEHRVVDLTGVTSPTALSYLPDEHRIAVAQNGCSPNCSIMLYDNGGNLVDKVSVGTNLRALTYVPTTKQFVGGRGADPTSLLFFSRTGQLVRSLDISSTTGIGAIMSVAFFNPSDPSGGEFLIASDSPLHTLFVIDFNGNLRAQYDYRKAFGMLIMTDLAAITTGPLAGAFSSIQSDTSEIVIFRLPEAEQP
jgi:hypothetical protein